MVAILLGTGFEESEALVTLREGKFHQVKRMLAGGIAKQ